ncbi:hypothetical protein M2404_003865 [Rheinheimera pacifica]|uniref:hypothetical protein n=1 Tax=Rheinheimera pacifica TaxID=173990 RepID=UPI0021682D66|nr:hypothetical protein [Rheinheimera pacifica]MCS4309493.1 hypothetical protein [Rheinheimera pacifica]
MKAAPKNTQKGQRKQIHPRISQNIYEMLELESKRTGYGLNQLVEQALVEFFNPAGRKTTEDIILKRLNSLKRDLSNIAIGNDIATQMIATYVKNWFIYQPQVPAEQREELLQIQERRFNQFLSTVTNNVTAGNSYLETITQGAFILREEIPEELFSEDGNDAS